MKIHKKIKAWVFCLVVLIAGSFLFFANQESASAISGDEAVLLGNCVNGALGDHYADDLCKFMDNPMPSECGPQQLYGKGDFEVQRAQAAKYLLPYRAEGYNDRNKPPSSITIVGEDNKSISTNGNQITYSLFTYKSQSFAAPGDDGITYWVYTSSYNPSYPILLVMFSTAGKPPVVATMVNLEGNFEGQKKPVCAYKLNKAALISTPTGGVPNVATPTNTESDEEACYASNWSLNWFVCPLITAASSSASKMYNFVEDQLKFRVEDGAKKDSLGDQKTRKDVKAAWNNFRILVSGLVVILMLVMVISQAIGSGPFDAYTVRKMLPRLVAGVILIQLSWPIFGWVINFVDDLGRGLADIIYAPFGGSSTMTFDKVMEPFGTEAITWNWVGVGALLIFGVVAPFIVLGLILSVLVAIFAGFLALLFRKILIILALITVPVALIAWMMPNEGLRRYWKLWWDNFLKALMMFPLIILIIAGGRIFAKIGSGQSDFVGFFIVLVGFFGPLFILPKTFKWGGTAMQLAGNALQKAQTATLKKPKEFLGERQKLYSAEKALQSQKRYSRNQRWNWKRPSSYWQRPIDLFKSGQYDPTLMLPGARLMRQRAMTQYFEKGEKSVQEDINAAEAKLIRERQRHRAAGGQHDVYLQAIASGLESFVDPNTGQTVQLGRRTQAERMAARKQLAKLGAGMNWRYLENYYEQASARLRANPNDTRARAEADEMRKFFDDNVETIMPRLPHIYKSIGQAADASPDAIAQMHGVEIESILANLSHQITTGTNIDGTPANIAQAQTSLTTFLQNYQRATESDRLGGQLENGGLRAMKAFLDSDQGLVDRINVDDEFHGRQQGARRSNNMRGETARNIPLLGRSDVIEASLDAQHAAALDQVRQGLSARISEDGFLRGPAAATTPPAPPPPIPPAP